MPIENPHAPVSHEKVHQGLQFTWGFALSLSDRNDVPPIQPEHLELRIGKVPGTMAIKKKTTPPVSKLKFALF